MAEFPQQSKPMILFRPTTETAFVNAGSTTRHSVGRVAASIDVFYDLLEPMHAGTKPTVVMVGLRRHFT